MEELKPCPFCGSEPRVSTGAGGYITIGCSDASCPIRPSLHGYFPSWQAPVLWNIRSHEMEEENKMSEK